ncbi:MAG: hypothetical protein JWP35_1684 [Caulobacter sp.]|nr:hypothetical protein [Caulobacter sp.]
MRKNHRLIGVLASVVVVAGCASPYPGVEIDTGLTATTSDRDCMVLAALIRTLPAGPDYAVYPVLLGGPLEQVDEELPGRPMLEQAGALASTRVRVACGGLVKPCAGVKRDYVKCVGLRAPMFSRDGQSAVVDGNVDFIQTRYLFRRGATGWDLVRTTHLYSRDTTVEDVT